MTDSSDTPDVIQRREQKINRRTLTYGLSVVLATAALVVAIVWLGSRRGECFGTDTLLCSQKDRRLAVFVPSLMLLLGSVGAFLRASLRLHRLRRLYIRPYMAWLLTGLTLVYLAGAFIFIEGNIL
ncbi:hypothetical protein EEB12_16570 [Rhodococcus sp. WS1]|jgi:hypothetical protein|uniref:hypothetical protein n=1 Tax=Rhodococcus TaxID=1827 RepID=UPI000A05FED6|nr:MULTISPECIES: hypothetical protein [Rhodococcus]MCQ4125373.1 hypothetical protein [Rhodococcus erythropolis]MDI9904128.1 hypothetical protein [Rhodococcus sp. IEGM 1406]ORI31011.1 hypothetical protein BH686_11930 [Rhodococcus erythropolis]OXM19566.1 hypothetical protein CBI33_21770 [Rhodococcus erythropolis]ROZ55409.1 hypothetical protein EEB12_16570 [Rhodococcus sp. WS1]